ncbi:MAG: organic solvent tolerance protein OstA [Planctomycetes bacterium]|nr:organic solvent tolerance protein OstA [Planctomycetota bacterium]
MVLLIIARTPMCCRRFSRFARSVGCCALVLLLSSVSFASDIGPAPAELSEPITVAADAYSRWQQGVYEVFHLRGNCYLNQGLTYARGPEAVLWVERGQSPGQPTKVIAYLEDRNGRGVMVDYRDASSKAGSLGREQASTWFQRLSTSMPLRLKLPEGAAQQVSPSASLPEIYQRGLAKFHPQRQRDLMLAQFTEFAPVPAGVSQTSLGMRSIQFGGRSDVFPDVKSQQLPNGQRVTTATGGFRVVIEGLPAGNVPAALGPIGMIDISTDRAVIWTEGGLVLGGQSVQSQDTPLEIYMEGNIEFRQGDRLITADRMFYDVRRQVGVILNAEMLTPLPKTENFEYQGLVRLRAAAIRQLDASHFTAIGAQVTTSRLEEPTYSFGSNQITFEDLQSQVFNPLTGESEINHRYLTESQGNTVYVRGIPVFYWPRMATDLSKPSFFIDNVRVGSDSIFGTQVLADFDAYQLFGIRNAPEGTDWGLSLDYLSDRGVGHGTDFQYDRQSFLGLEGPAQGQLNFWGIADDGLDNLGLGRRTIVPEEDYRFRLFGRHRQQLQNGWELTSEAGWISDRTFLEQYYEREWDEFKDPRNGLRLRRLADNRALSIEANVQQNDFFTETQWLPRVDHYWLGESLLGDRLTWFEHSQAGYANLNNADAPTNATLAAQVDAGLPWEVGAGQEGERLVTRQEIDMPLAIGPVKVVPFALGELAHWGEALDGSALQRAYVNAGVRASVPFWAVFPDFRDPLFNLHGLAHKVVFDAEFTYADANRNFSELPLYDPLDDMSITEFRRRVFDPTLPTTITDPKFSPVTYALRSGLQGWVTSPSTEVVDDLMTLRTGMRHRWQTKRGGPGREHVVDWLTVDSNLTYFPDQNRDNFGQEFGLFDYDVRWHLGDRFTIVSDGAADFFGNGLRMVSGGVLLNRPTRGNAYLGVRSISGPIDSNVLLASYNYRLSPKWISSAGLAYDFSATGSIGQTFSMTRIGESLLVSMGFNVDNAKNNVGVKFMVEPRFLPKLGLTSRTGIEVPPAGAFGLE